MKKEERERENVNRVFRSDINKQGERKKVGEDISLAKNIYARNPRNGNSRRGERGRVGRKCNSIHGKSQPML